MATDDNNEHTVQHDYALRKYIEIVDPPFLPVLNIYQRKHSLAIRHNRKCEGSPCSSDMTRYQILPTTVSSSSSRQISLVRKLYS